MQKLRGRNLGNALLVVLTIPIIVYAFSAGPISGVTGGFGEPTCNQSGCHVGTAVNGGPGNVAISVPSSYTSGEMIPITVTVSDSDQQRWGFELSARTEGGEPAGTLIPGTNGFTQRRPDLNGVQYISHTQAGTRSGTSGGASFDFMWQAPDVSEGPVIFHAAGNAANNNFGPSGDRIYTTSATSRPPDGSVGCARAGTTRPRPPRPAAVGRRWPRRGGPRCSQRSRPRSLKPRASLSRGWSPSSCRRCP